ncbi:MAG TPA: nitroreductase family protein [Acidimicrobiales bacterium]|nr:nitroreductase family protein [Acidimicrobiales bacterium]
MEFQDVVRRRRMVRNFEDRPVPAAVLDRILDNALHAPSAGFSQGWAFLVLEGPEETGRFWDATWEGRGRERAAFRWQGMFRAPVIVVPLSHKQAYLDRYAEPDKGVTDRRESFWPIPYWDVDTGFAALLMLLTAVDAGLGACFFGVFPGQLASFRRHFDVPGAYTPVGALAIGYRAPDEPSPSLSRGRRPAAEVVHRGRFRAAPG